MRVEATRRGWLLMQTYSCGLSHSIAWQCLQPCGHLQASAFSAESVATNLEHNGPCVTGRIVDADMVKPVKASPPPPPGLPAPPARGKKKKGGGGGSPAVPPPAGRARPASAPAPAGPTKRQHREQQRAAAAALRAAAAPDYARDSAAGGSEFDGGSGAAASARAGGVQPRGAKLRFPPGQRPVELQVWMCPGWAGPARKHVLCAGHQAPPPRLLVGADCARLALPAYGMPLNFPPACSGARTLTSVASVLFTAARTATET